MKGTREPLLLIATGIFLCAFWYPAVIGFAGIALGMQDLRKSELGASLGRRRVVLAGASWVCSALWVWSWIGIPQSLVLPMVLIQALTLSGTGLALRAVARSEGATGLARAILVFSLCPLAYFPLLLANQPELTVLVYTSSCVALGILVLKLRSHFLPYGRRVVRSQSA